MSSINPLFSDSTKPVGDKIVTNVELIEIILEDNNLIYFEIATPTNPSLRYGLQIIPTKRSIKYRTEVWLPPGQQFNYRFVIECEGQPIQASPFQQGTSGQDIFQKWTPCLETKFNLDNSMDHPKNKRKSPSTKNPKSLNIKETFQKPLGKPQSLDEIKSLLDDLL